MKLPNIDSASNGNQNEYALTKSYELRYLPALNGLRGVAVLLVFLFHADINGFSGAFLGVDIFFVLSGFLITMLLVQEYERRGGICLKLFYIRRALRLMPALVFLLSVYLLFIFLWPHDVQQQARELEDTLFALLYISNWTRALDMQRPSLLGHTWSLSMEEQFYLIWPILLGFTLKGGFRRSLLVTISLLLASWGWRLWLLHQGASWDRLYNGFDTRADMLLFGCLVALLLRSGYLGFWQKKPGLARALVFIATGSLSAMVPQLDWQQNSLYVWQHALIGLSSAILIIEIVSMPKGILSTFLQRRWLVWTGKLSYGIYLWHYPLLQTPFTAGLPIPQRFVFTFLLTLIFSVFSWYVIEQPVLALKKRFR